MFIGSSDPHTVQRCPAKTLSRIKSDSSSAIEPMSVKNSLPIRSARIHVFSPADEDDTQTVELIHHLKKVLYTSCDPVERSDEHDREFLPPRIPR
jgi:hypothetical protein